MICYFNILLGMPLRLLNSPSSPLYFLETHIYHKLWIEHPRLAVFMFNLKTKSDTTFQQLWAVSFPPWNATVFLPTVLRRWCTFFVLFQNLSSPQHMSRVTCRCVTVTLYQILPPSDFSPFAGITNPLNHSKNFFEFLHSSPTPPPFYLKSRSVFLR